jgi:large subunit ribosomal protein L30
MSPVNLTRKTRSKRKAPPPPAGALTISSKTKPAGKKLKVTLTRGWAGKREDQLKVLRGLGLRRRMQSNIVPDNKAVLGMIAKVSHLVTVEPAE